MSDVVRQSTEPAMPGLADAVDEHDDLQEHTHPLPRSVRIALGVYGLLLALVLSSLAIAGAQRDQQTRAAVQVELDRRTELTREANDRQQRTIVANRQITDALVLEVQLLLDRLDQSGIDVTGIPPAPPRPPERTP